MVTFCYQRRILGIILKSQPWQPDEAILSGLPHSGPNVVLNVVFGLIWKILFEDHQLYGRLVRRWHWICLWCGAWAFCSQEKGIGSEQAGVPGSSWNMQLGTGMQWFLDTERHKHHFQRGASILQRRRSIRMCWISLSTPGFHSWSLPGAESPLRAMRRSDIPW